MSEVSKDVHSRSFGRQKHQSATEGPSLVRSTPAPVNAATSPAHLVMASSSSPPSLTNMISDTSPSIASPTSTLYVPLKENDGAHDDLMGVMLGMLGGIAILLIIIITLSSIKRTKRQQRLRQRPGSPTKCGWDVRESWYSDTLSICPSTLPPPYYYESGIYTNSSKKEPLSPSLQLPTATLQYSSRTQVQEQTTLKISHEEPTTAITPKSAPQYFPQLAFSPSFNTSVLVKKIDPNTIAVPPPPFQAHPQQQLASVVQPPSPTATKSTPHYSPQLAFSPSLYTADLVRTVHPSSGQQLSLSSLPLPHTSESTPPSHIPAAKEAPRPKTSRSTIRSYQAQLNKDL